MDQILEDFIFALRRSGVRTSVDESIEAVRAVEVVGYQDKEILRNALSVVLAKSEMEKRIFEECFERFFVFDRFSGLEEDVAEPTIADLQGEESPLTQMLLSGDGAGLGMSMNKAAHEAGVTAIQFFTQKGLYIQRILGHMGLEGLTSDIQRLSERDGLTDRVRKLEAAKGELYERVKNFVERQFQLFASSAAEEMVEQYLRNTGLTNIDHRDFQRMRIIVQKMAKRLNALYSRRRKTSRRGQLDFKKTLRENITYDGLLFEPRWKKRKVDRPDVIAICDVSRSVRNVSRFLLLFLYSLNEVIERIRTFVFCSNLVEVSHIFDELSVEEAIGKIESGAGLNIMLGLTDYGQSLVDFKENWLDTITKKTTVLILGDARNNYGDPRTDILREMKERSRRLVWLNPESEQFWDTGDSEMLRYIPHCHLVRKCSTLNHLERLVEILMRASLWQ